MHYQRQRAGAPIGTHETKKRPNGTTYRLVAAAALGRPLPARAVVHHINGDDRDDRPDNLVICPNQAYHVLLHQRQWALEQCAHADWLKCHYCKKYDAPENLRLRKNRRQGMHRSCQATARREARNGQM